MGLDRVLLAMAAEDREEKDRRSPRCFVVAVSPAATAQARGLVRALRDAGVSAVRSFAERPLKAQLKMADRAGAAYTAILGERELADGTVTLRRMADGEQESVALAALPERLGVETT
jgi:histidyl-tRNA synthetase